MKKNKFIYLICMILLVIPIVIGDGSETLLFPTSNNIVFNTTGTSKTLTFSCEGKSDTNSGLQQYYNISSGTAWDFGDGFNSTNTTSASTDVTNTSITYSFGPGNYSVQCYHYIQEEPYNVTNIVTFSEAFAVDEAPNYWNVYLYSDDDSINYYNYTEWISGGDGISTDGKTGLGNLKMTLNGTNAFTNIASGQGQITIDDQYLPSILVTIWGCDALDTCTKYLGNRGGNYANTSRISDSKTISGNYSFEVVTHTNSAPTTTLTINATDHPNNYTTANITAYNTTNDNEDDPVKLSYDWMKDGISIAVLNMPFENGSSNDTYTIDYSSYSNGVNTSLTNATFSSTGGYDGFGRYSFDGVNEQIVINHANNFFIPKNITIMAWVYLNTSGSYPSILTKPYSYLYQLNSATQKPSLFMYGGINQVWTNSASTALTLNKWEHIAVTWNGSLITYYLNGQPDGTISANGTIPSLIQNITIGRRYDGYGWNGSIDEVMLLNISLTSNQINAIYQNQTDIILSNETVKNSLYSVKVIPNDGIVDGTAVYSENVTILNTAPITTLTINATDHPNNYTTANITAWNTTSDSDGDSVTNVYNWMKDGKSLSVVNMPFLSDGSNNASDYSDSNNDGIPYNVTWNVTGGRFGDGAYEWEVNGGKINITSTTDFDWNNDWTISLWKYQRGTGILLSKRLTNAYSAGFVLITGAATLDMYISSTGSSWDITAPLRASGANLNTWTHVVVTKVGTNYSLYRNGTLEDSVISSSVIYYDSNSPIIIGADSNANFFNGSITELLILNNTGLSPEAVQALYANQTHVLNNNQTIKGSLYSVKVIPNDGSEDGTAVYSENVTILNTAPTIGQTPAITPTTSYYNSNLNCSGMINDSDTEETLQISYRWYQNTSRVTAYDVNNLTVSNGVLNYTNTNVTQTLYKGDQWTCEVQGYDGTALTSWTNSTALTISNTAPTTGTPTIIPTTAYTNSSLNCSGIINESDGIDTLQISYRWYNSTTRVTAYDINNKTATNGTAIWTNTNVSALKKYEVWTCEVQGYDGTVLTSWSNSTALNISNSIPYLTSVNITTDDITHNYTTANLTAQYHFNDYDSDDSDSAVEYIWFNNSVRVSGLDNITLINALNTSRGDNWTVEVRVYDDYNWSTRTNSSSTNIVNYPVSIGIPSIIPGNILITDSINTSVNITDYDSDSNYARIVDQLNVSFIWFKNNVRVGGTTETINKSVTSGNIIYTNTNLSYSYFSVGNVLKSGVQVFDGLTLSSWMNSTSKTVGSTTSLQLDIDFNSPTPSNTSLINTSSITINVTSIDYKEIYNVTLEFDGMNESFTTNDTNNWYETKSNLLDGNYSVNVYIFATDDTVNTTGLRQFMVNTSVPSIYKYDAYTNGTNYKDHTRTYGESVVELVDVNSTTKSYNYSQYVNFTVTAPGGALVVNNVNGTRFNTTMWNSSAYTINETGTWTVSVTAKDNQNDYNTYAWTYSITDTINVNPTEYVVAPDPRNQTHKFNISVYHDSDVSWIYEFFGNMTNGTFAVYANGANVSNLTVNDTSSSDARTIEITINSTIAETSIADGIYNGTVYYRRLGVNGWETNYTINLSLQINPPAGIIHAVDSDYVICESSSCDNTVSTSPNSGWSYTYRFNNTGNYTLSDCVISFSNSLDGVSWLTFERQNFTVSIGGSNSSKIILSAVPEGSYYGWMEVTCNATVLGYKDSLSSKSSDKQPFLQITSAMPVVNSSGGGGGGGGGAPTTTTVLTKEEVVEAVKEELARCGDGICQDDEAPWSCSADCKFNLDEVFSLKVFDNTWFVKIAAYGLLGAAGFIAYTMSVKKIKKKKKGKNE